MVCWNTKQLGNPKRENWFPSHGGLLQVDLLVKGSRVRTGQKVLGYLPGLPLPLWEERIYSRGLQNPFLFQITLLHTRSSRLLLLLELPPISAATAPRPPSPLLLSCPLSFVLRAGPPHHHHNRITSALFQQVVQDAKTLSSDAATKKQVRLLSDILALYFTRACVKSLRHMSQTHTNGVNSTHLKCQSWGTRDKQIPGVCLAKSLRFRPAGEPIAATQNKHNPKQ